MEQMINENFVHSIADIFTLHKHRAAIIELPGIGKKKIDNLLNNIEEATKAAKLPKILFALAIPSVGDSMCKQLSKKYKTMSNLSTKTEKDLLNDGFTGGVAKSVVRFFSDAENQKMLEDLRAVGLVS